MNFNSDRYKTRAPYQMQISSWNVKIMLHWGAGDSHHAGEGGWKSTLTGVSAKEQARPRRHRWALGRHYLSWIVPGSSWPQVSFLLGHLGISGDPSFHPPSHRHVFGIARGCPHGHRVLGPEMVLLTCALRLQPPPPADARWKGAELVQCSGESDGPGAALQWPGQAAHGRARGFYLLLSITVFEKVVFYVFEGNINTKADSEGAKIKTRLGPPRVLKAHHRA